MTTQERRLELDAERGRRHKALIETAKAKLDAQRANHQRLSDAASAESVRVAIKIVETDLLWRTKAEIHELAAELFETKKSDTKKELMPRIADHWAGKSPEVEPLLTATKEARPDYRIDFAIRAAADKYKHKRDFVARLAEFQFCTTDSWDSGALETIIAREVEADLWENVLRLWTDKDTRTFQECIDYVIWYHLSDTYNNSSGGSPGHRFHRETAGDAVGRWICDNRGVNPLEHERNDSQ